MIDVNVTKSDSPHVLLEKSIISEKSHLNYRDEILIA